MTEHLSSILQKVSNRLEENKFGENEIEYLTEILENFLDNGSYNKRLAELLVKGYVFEQYENFTITEKANLISTINNEH